MTTGRRFPILRGQYRSRFHPADKRHRTLEQQGVPASVQWSFVAPHEAQCKRNHGQTIERLSQRGGLSPAEMWAVVTGKRMCDIFEMVPDGWDADDVAIEPLLRLIEDHDG